MNVGFTPLVIDDVIEMYGPLPPGISRSAVGEMIAGMAWRRLTQNERDDAFLETLKVCDNPDLAAACPSGALRWDTGWQEVLDTIKIHGVSLDTLRPQYFKYNIIRFCGDYALVNELTFEFQLYRMIFRILYEEFLNHHDAVIEVCCGTGLNLLEIGELNPAIKLIGYDWAKSSQKILSRIAQSRGLDLKGHRLDLWTLNGFDASQTPAGRTALLTAHGLEQLGSTLDPFFELVKQIQPEIVVHIEPLIEYYNDDLFFDHVAIRYHHRRNYLAGLLSKVKEMEKRNQATIIKSKRLGYGSIFHEGYSLLIWKPTL